MKRAFSSSFAVVSLRSPWIQWKFGKNPCVVKKDRAD